MKHMAMQHVWVDRYGSIGAVRVETANNTEGIARRLWKYSWGLLLILTLTGLSEYGPRIAYSKMASDLHAVTQQTVHWIK